MIIIKDQWGSIAEYKNISVLSDKDIAGNYSCEEVSDGMGGTTEIQNYEMLGKYKTEERAKEVMEEIETHIGVLMFNKMHGNSDIIMDEVGYVGAREYIFHMPKE